MSVPIDVTAKRTLIELRVIIFTSLRFVLFETFLTVFVAVFSRSP